MKNTTPLDKSVESVVSRGNCSGCGGCARLSPSISMELDPEGYLRPSWTGPPSAADSATFNRICPGVEVPALHPAGSNRHDTMSDYVSAWAAYAGDPDVRFEGSSGGVLTALSAWLLDTGRVSKVIGSVSSQSAPARTVALTLRTRKEVLGASGSRYAPVAAVATLDPQEAGVAFVGKPCEVYAARRLLGETGENGPGQPAEQTPPVLLSFFCAGVPSQDATDELVSELGVDAAQLTSLRYRGRGWPGSFVVEDASGQSRSMSYEDSWGAHLGRRLQPRCAICPDGVGGYADIAVGDYWQSDARGFPVFDDAEGMSVAIARTPVGHSILLEAMAAGVIVGRPLDLDLVAAIQPLQTKRRAQLVGRLAGRLLAGHPVPSFPGYHLLRLGARRPKDTFWAFVGSYARSRRRSVAAAKASTQVMKDGPPRVLNP